jgi:transcriptional regulator with XRE-family HTH domain
METISERLRAERLRLGLTQEQLAKAGGVARSAQANYEKGERSPDAQYLAAVASAGVDVAFVVTGLRAVPASNSLSARAVVVAENFENLSGDDQKCLERVLIALAH